MLKLIINKFKKDINLKIWSPESQIKIKKFQSKKIKLNKNKQDLNYLKWNLGNTAILWGVIQRIDTKIQLIQVWNNVKIVFIWNILENISELRKFK